MTTKNKCLVILSGGQDSTTCLLMAKHSGMFDEVHAVTFDYGQRHRVEINAARAVAALVGVTSHRVVNVEGLLLSRSPLTDPTRPLETYSSFKQMDAVIGNRIEDTFVPLRNLAFLVLATNVALSLDCFNVMTGVCAMDNANYPDCTPEFVQAAQIAMREALGMYRASHRGPQVNILTPLINSSKADIAHLALNSPQGAEAMALTHTCYAGAVPPCGKCHACVLRAEGFRVAGRIDPLLARFAPGKNIDPDNRIFHIGTGE